MQILSAREIDYGVSIPMDRLHSYFRVIQEGLGVRRHLDLLRWLQGEIQHHLPHEIMIVAWGDFASNFIQHDIVSSLPGARTAYFEPADLSFQFQKLYRHWTRQGKIPSASNIDTSDILHLDSHGQSRFSRILQGMQSFLLHGISDSRRCEDCIYVIFSTSDKFDDGALTMMELLLPYLDIALRRIAPFPHLSARRADSVGSKGHGLSERENEIMDWVGKGKTNAEIGRILSISEFTVRNHLYHIFQKLGVYNRTQAASKIAQTWGMRSEQHVNEASDTLFPQTPDLPLADGL